MPMGNKATSQPGEIVIVSNSENWFLVHPHFSRRDITTLVKWKGSGEIACNLQGDERVFDTRPSWLHQPPSRIVNPVSYREFAKATARQWFHGLLEHPSGLAKSCSHVTKYRARLKGISILYFADQQARLPRGSANAQAGVGVSERSTCRTGMICINFLETLNYNQSHLTIFIHFDTSQRGDGNGQWDEPHGTDLSLCVDSTSGALGRRADLAQTCALLAGRCRGGWVRYISFFLRCMSLLPSVVLIIIISFQDLEITKEIRVKLKSLSQVEYCQSSLVQIC